MRAVLRATRTWHDSRWHVVTNSYRVPVEEGEYWRPGEELEVDTRDMDEEENLEELENDLEDLEEELDEEDELWESDEWLRVLEARRLGQVPQWLDFGELNKVQDDDVERAVYLHHDTDLFRPAPGAADGVAGLAAWRHEVLPTFDRCASTHSAYRSLTRRLAWRSSRSWRTCRRTSSRSTRCC